MLLSEQFAPDTVEHYVLSRKRLYDLGFLGHNVSDRHRRFRNMEFRVGEAKDGRKLVLHDSGFVASYVDGKWVNRIMFSVTEQNDFVRIRDEVKAQQVYDEACKALNNKLVSA